MSGSLFLAAVFFLLVSLRKLYRRHYRRAIAYISLASLIAVAGFILYQVQLNLEGYSVIHNERDVVEVDQSSLLKGEVVIIRDLVGNKSYRWSPKGDRWRIELRTLRLKSLCKALQWPEYYRLLRLKAYDATEGEAGTVHSVLLRQESRGWDVWSRLRSFKAKRPDLAADIESCLETELLVSDEQNLSAGSISRFYFKDGNLELRRLSD